jgi:hypothetical protein
MGIEADENRIERAPQVRWIDVHPEPAVSFPPKSLATAISLRSSDDAAHSKNLQPPMHPLVPQFAPGWPDGDPLEHHVEYPAREM